MDKFTKIENIIDFSAKNKRLILQDANNRLLFLDKDKGNQKPLTFKFSNNILITSFKTSYTSLIIETVIESILEKEDSI